MPVFMDAPYYPKKLLMAQLREAAPSMESVAGALDGLVFNHYGAFGTLNGNPADEAPVETALSDMWETQPPVSTFLSATPIEIDPTQIQILQGLGGILPSGADSILRNLCATGPAPCDLLSTEQQKTQCRAIWTTTCAATGKAPGATDAPADGGMDSTTKTVLIGGGIAVALLALFLVMR